jgi:hypothetical protein
MTALPITVETQDLVVAARMLRLWSVDPLERSTNSLTAALADTGAMAGSDVGGLAWAASYDRSAAAVLNATASAINGLDAVAAMFGQTARNYAAAESASTADDRRTVDATLDALPAQRRQYFLSVCLPASAAGGSGATPSGWGLIEHLVGYVWPNGHQDRLRRAAAAWRASAAAIHGAAEAALDGYRLAAADGLPEAADMRTACHAMTDRLRRLGNLHTGLAAACDDLARHIDDVHSEVEGELTSLVEWTAGIQVIGGLLSAISLGTAQAPTQAAEAARVAGAAARVSQLIARFVAVVNAAAHSIAAFAEKADQIAGELMGLSGVRLTTVVVATVARLRTVRAVEETRALARLENDAYLALRHIDDPRLFDPAALRGIALRDVQEAMPAGWPKRATEGGGGEIFRDPVHRGRQIRLMPGYLHGARPGDINAGPYAVVSQNGGKVKVPLAGNPVLT